MQTSSPNSPYFNASRWRGSVLALATANEPKAIVVLPKATVTDAQIEAQKVVNVERPIGSPVVQVLSAVNMGLTVTAMRKVAKKRGLKGYSKLLKADLCAILA